MGGIYQTWRDRFLPLEGRSPAMNGEKARAFVLDMVDRRFGES